MKRKLIVALVAVAFIASGVWARAAGDAAKDLAALEREYAATDLPWRDADAAFEPRFAKLAETYPGTEQALAAKVRVLSFFARFEKDPAAVQRADDLVDAILAEFPQSPQLVDVWDTQHVLSSKKRVELEQALTEPSRPDVVRASVMLTRGAWDLQSPKPDIKARGRASLEDLIRKFKDLPLKYSTVGAAADAYLHPLAPEDLAVGRPAPEIAGKSVDGKAIKLSDFKGKVVVVDFFGDW